MEAVDPACTWEAGEVVGVYDSRLSLDGCEIPAGVVLRLHVVEVTPVVVRIEVTSHPDCEPAPDERQKLRTLRRQAVREAHDRWGDAFIVEYATGDCTDTRRVDVEVTETR